MTKISRYNHFHSLEDGSVGAINLFTNATLALPPDAWRRAQLLLKNPDIADLDPDLHALFRSTGFIVDEDFDELSALEEIFKISKGGARQFSLGIITSLQCNFRCPYCYQDHQDSRMSSAVQDSIVKYLERTLPGKSAFHIAWWGGEPLLEAKLIDSFGHRIMTLCESLGVRYSSSIISNCYLLTPANISVLNRANLNHLQVTLDGPETFHNQRRYLINGKGTYRKIMNGLRNLTQALPTLGITVRVNVSRGITDIEPWHQLFDDLEPLKKHVALHFTPVAPAGNFVQLCMPKHRFDDFYRKITELAQAREFAITSGRKQPGTVYCGAIPVSNWLIHPRGYITKCTARMDSPEGSLGKLLPDGTVELNDEAPLWLGFTPFEIEECRNCEVLPTCMGGCLKIPMHKDPFLDRCGLKSGISQYLKDRIIRERTGGNAQVAIRTR